MRCKSCNAEMFGLSYKKYLSKDNTTGKAQWVETKEVEDLCPQCIKWTYDDCNSDETIDIHNDLSIGMDLPKSNLDY